MTMQDITSDVITRIRNAQKALKESVVVPYSNLVADLLKILVDEGYVASFEAFEERPGCRSFKVMLKYYEGRGVIDRITRVSKPGLRVYRSFKDLPSVLGGLGLAIISTSKGVVSDREARRLGVGGEILCFVE